MDSKTLIPLLGPFITVFLGIISLPFLESLKKRLDRKRLLKAFLEELNDEILAIDHIVSSMAGSFQHSLDMLNGISFDFYMHIYPGPLKLYSAEALLENHFENLDPKIRQSLKQLLEYIMFLNNINSNMDTSYHNALNEAGDDFTHRTILVDEINCYLCNILIYRHVSSYLIDILTKSSSDLKTAREIIFKDTVINQARLAGAEDIISKLRIH